MVLQSHFGITNLHALYLNFIIPDTLVRKPGIEYQFCNHLSGCRCTYVLLWTPAVDAGIWLLFRMHTSDATCAESCACGLNSIHFAGDQDLPTTMHGPCTAVTYTHIHVHTPQTQYTYTYIDASWVQQDTLAYFNRCTCTITSTEPHCNACHRVHAYKPSLHTVSTHTPIHTYTHMHMHVRTCK